MQKQFYFLSPVEVVKVTQENLEEAAEWCKGSIQEADSRRKPGEKDKYVLVPTANDKQVSWAFPGMFITRRLVVTVKNELRYTFAVYKRDYFDKNYFEEPKQAVDKTWERAERERNRKPKKTSKNEVNVHLTTNVGQELIRAQEKIRELSEKLDKAAADRVPEVVPAVLMEEQEKSLVGKSEAEVEKTLNQISMHIQNEPAGGVAAAMARAYQNIGAAQNLRGL